MFELLVTAYAWSGVALIGLALYCVGQNVVKELRGDRSEEMLRLLAAGAIIGVPLLLAAILS